MALNELNEMATNMFGNVVKAVVDIDKELIAVDAELHSDLEALLLEDGSEQKSLWVSIYIPKLRVKSLWQKYLTFLNLPSMKMLILHH